MGLFSFIKEAGAKIFGSSPAKAATADDLQKELAGHGLPSDVSIQIDGDKVKVGGKAVSTEEAEKIILALGNTTGVAQVESDLIVNKEAPAAVFYTVKKGDTLSKIAKTHYGSANAWKQIFEANRDTIDDPDRIFPGQVIKLPPKPADA